MFTRTLLSRTLLGLAGLLVGLSAPLARAADTLVATLPGEFSVDNKGSANYSMPLAIPPGRSGMQPTLSLNYSSGGGNGPLGVGFSLSTGFPQSITRGRSILARDGVTRGVTFTSDDKLYLDGKRLIRVSGTYGAPGSTYRTEVDSFVTIAATGTGSTIETFVVTDKSGTRMTFGKYSATTDGYQSGAGETAGLAYAYALKCVEDMVGNYLEFAYQVAGNGEYALSQISYTGTRTPEVAPQVTVSIENVPGRSDQQTSYIASAAWPPSPPPTALSPPTPTPAGSRRSPLPPPA